MQCGTHPCSSIDMIWTLLHWEYSAIIDFLVHSLFRVPKITATHQDLFKQARTFDYSLIGICFRAYWCQQQSQLKHDKTSSTDMIEQVRITLIGTSTKNNWSSTFMIEGIRITANTAACSGFVIFCQISHSQYICCLKLLTWVHQYTTLIFHEQILLCWLFIFLWILIFAWYIYISSSIAAFWLLLTLQ